MIEICIDKLYLVYKNEQTIEFKIKAYLYAKFLNDYDRNNYKL